MRRMASQPRRTISLSSRAHARQQGFTADFKKRVEIEALRGDRTVQEIAAP